MSFSLDDATDDFTRWERQQTSVPKILALVALGISAVAVLMFLAQR